MKLFKNILHAGLILFAAMALSIETAAAATVSGVQTGTAVSNGNGTIVVPIAAVTPASSFLIFDTRHTSNRPPGSMLRGRLASATTLEFTRVTNETAAIAFDAQSGNSGSSISSISWNHTIGTASNRKLIVGVSTEQGDLSGAEVITGVTYNGVALTFARAASVATTNNFVNRTEIWYLDEDQLPPSGSATIQVNFTGTVRDTNVGAISIAGAEAGAPEATAANTSIGAASITTPITTLTNGAWIIDVVGSGNGGNYTPGGGQTERWDLTSPLFTSTGAASTKIDAVAGANSMTQTHNTTSLRTTHVVISVAPAQPRIDIEWSVVEFSAGVTVQRGAVNQTGTVVNVPITAVGGLNQAFVTWSKTPSATDSLWSNDDPIVGELTLPTNLQFRVNGANAGHVIWWQVIEFTNAADINVQKGTLGTMTGATTSVTATLGTPVNVNTTFVLASFRTPGSGADVGRRMLRARLTNSTTITFDRSIGGFGDNMTEIVWQAVDLRDGSTVQRGSENFAQGVAQKLVAISSVDTNRSVAFASVQPVGGQNMGRSPYAGDDIIGVGSVTMALAPTQITMTRNNTKATTDIGWFVVEFNTTPPTPLGYYAMDEGSWTIPGDVIDSSGNGNHGNPVGNVSTAGATPAIAGNPGTCGYGVVPFNGSNAIIDAVDTTLTPGNTGSVTFWYNSRLAWNVGSRRKLLDASNTGPVRRFFLTKMPNSSLRFRIEDSTGAPIVANTGLNLFPANTWVHIAVTWDLPNNRIEIYVNGVLGGFATTAIGTLGTPNTLYVGDNRVVGAGGTGNTGRSADGSVDEVRVYGIPVSAGQVVTDIAATHPCATVDHYEIDHVGGSGGVAVTCEAEPVTIIAHDSGHTPIAPGATTTITGSTSPNADQWALRVGLGAFTDLGGGQFSYTFAAGETQVGLWLTRTTPATIDIDIVDGSGNTEDATEDPSLEFRDTAFRFFADGVPAAIGTQISRKENTIAPGIQAMTLRAVQTSTTTGACEARLTGPQVVEMAFECDNPNTCIAGQSVTVTGAPSVPIPGNPDGSVTSYANVNLTFDATGTAPFTFNYTDAGRIALHARKALAASPPDPAITLTGASNDFVVRPAGLCVESTDANSGCVSPDATCSAFTKAGTSAFVDSQFNLTISAVGWETAGETNEDFCTANIVTPNFRLSSIGLSPNLIAPDMLLGGVNGNLGVTSVDIVAGDGGQRTISNQAIDEVGVFTITASPPAYLGETIADSDSDNIGRFYPDRFNITPNVPTFAHSCIAGTFTYTDETFYYGTPPALMLEAVNTAGVRTNNYGGTGLQRFWMLSTQLPGRSYMDQAGASAMWNAPILDPLTVTLSDDTDYDGDGTLTMDVGMGGDAFSYQRFTPEQPFPALVDLKFLAAELRDPDGVCYDLLNDGTCDDFDITGIGGTEMRFGRLVIQNAFGAEVLPLPVPMRAEYFVNAATGFATNTADTCTTLSEDYLDLVNDIDDPPLGATPATINIGGGTSTGTIGSSPMVAGDAGLSFNAPGADNTGYVDIEANLTAPAMAQPPLPWLMYDWDGDNSYDDHPTGRGTFGVYSGSGRHIYLRELY